MILNKTITAKLFSLLVAATLCFTVFTVPVSAKDSDGDPNKKDEKTKLTFLEDVDSEEPEPTVVEPVFENGRWDKVHSNPATFEKNFILSPKQKEYSIKKYEAVATAILEPEMSDLEKYYTLAIWLNHHVNYDWLFWPSPYDFDYYSHQWDAYGVLKERQSVCAGIAIAYANLCHAADLPCKFIRMKPYYLDHTINYIPDINGHAYYIDVTEDIFFMSDEANPWNPMDPEFAYIPEDQIPHDGSFEYYEGQYEGKDVYKPSTIKEFYDVSFDEWFTEYALHKKTEKDFRTPYDEKGSGTRGTHYASYKDYPKQFSDTEKPGLWFLEDFYEDPELIRSKILGKKFDGQLLNISGIQGSYDCNNAEELAQYVSNDIEIKYFPSAKNNQVVAESTPLYKNTDYIVSCDDFNEETGEATIKITGTGTYTGIHEIPVKFNTAAVTKDPVNNMDLVYTGKPQVLVEPGEAVNGTILYAAYNKEGEDESWKKGNPDAAPYPEPDLVYSEELPTATDAGRYAVWYKVEGDENYFDVPPQRLDRVAVISPLQPKIIADNETIKVGDNIKLSPALDIEKAADFNCISFEDDIATVSDDGILRGVAVGTTTVSITGALTEDDPNYVDPDDIEISVTVNKGDNPIKLKAKTAKVKRSKLRKKAQKIKRAKLIKVSNAQGKLNYKLVSAKKGKKSFKKYFKVNSKNGKVTVKKGLKKGKYLLKVKVKAAGNANYLPSSWKTVTTKVRVK